MGGWQAKLNHFDVPHMKSLIFLTEIYNFESCFWLPALWPESIKCRWVPDMQLGEGVWPDTKRWKMQLFTETFLQPESRSWEEFQPKSGSWEEEKERTCPIVHQLPIQLSCCLVALSWTLMVLMPFSFVMVKIPSCWKLTWQIYMSCRVQFNACCWDSTQLNRFHSWLFDPVSNIARLALKKEKQIDVETCLLEATLKKVATSLVAASLLCPSWNTYCDSLPTFSPLFLTPWFYCNLNAQMSGWVGPDINLN